MFYKALIFTCLLTFSITSFASLERANSSPPIKYVWTALAPNVLKAIVKSKVRVFNPVEMIRGKNEHYFKISEDDLLNLSHFVHHYFKRCGGFRLLSSPPKSSLIGAQDKGFSDVEFGEFWPNELDKLINLNYTINQHAEVQDWFQSISETHMNDIITTLSSYHTRYYKSQEGIDALKWIGSEWEKLTQIRSDISVEYFQHNGFLQPSVILTIKGSSSDEEKKNQIIILGGHGDSINCDDPEKGLRSPGANDNAAGIALLTDMIKIMVEKNYRPKHTIQFIAYAAEEVGLRGSGELAQMYHQNKKQVIGIMQFDGVNYTGTTYDMALIADATNPAQDKFVARLIDEYIKASWSWDKCGYACSDHYSWHIEGYRTSFPVEAIMSEQDPFIHTANDTFSQSNFSSNHAALFEKLGIAYLLELDNN